MISDYKREAIPESANKLYHSHEVINLLKDTDMHIYRPRASTRPSKDWRRQVQAQGEGKGHPRVWLMGDAVHAMLPNRYASQKT